MPRKDLARRGKTTPTKMLKGAKRNIPPNIKKSRAAHVAERRRCDSKHRLAGLSPKLLLFRPDVVGKDELDSLKYPCGATLDVVPRKCVESHEALADKLRRAACVEKVYALQYEIGKLWLPERQDVAKQWLELSSSNGSLSASRFLVQLFSDKAYEFSRKLYIRCTQQCMCRSVDWNGSPVICDTCKHSFEKIARSFEQEGRVSEAYKWFCEGAIVGDALCQFNVGRMHLLGIHVDACPIAANAWFARCVQTYPKLNQLVKDIRLKHLIEMSG